MQMIEHWLAGSVWLRYLTLAVWAGLITVAIWLILLKPQQDRVNFLVNQNEQHAAQFAVLRDKVMAIPATVQVAATQEDKVVEERPFSVMDFIRQSEGKLITWQPDDKQGELQLVLDWQKVPPLFALLAQYSAVRLASFDIVPEGTRLRMTLTLHFSADEIE